MTDMTTDALELYCRNLSKAKNGLTVYDRELLMDVSARLCELQRRIAEDDKAREEGRLVELPLVAMVERSLQGGKMKPDRDQRFNGRYAVVYSGKGKWGSPLIDICGTPYNSDQAEERKNELTRQEAEATLEGTE